VRPRAPSELAGISAKGCARATGGLSDTLRRLDALAEDRPERPRTSPSSRRRAAGDMDTARGVLDAASKRLAMLATAWDGELMARAAVAAARTAAVGMAWGDAGVRMRLGDLLPVLVCLLVVRFSCATGRVGGAAAAASMLAGGSLVTSVSDSARAAWPRIGRRCGWRCCADE
jgi:hypothetical protein